MTETISQVFVGNLPFSTTDEELNALFAEHGEILSAQVAAFPEGKSKGYGIVLYTTPDEAAASIDALSGYNLGGRALEVRLDRGSNKEFYGAQEGPNTRREVKKTFQPKTKKAALPFAQGENVEGRVLYVGNLPFSTSWQDLKDIFREAGDVSHAHVPTNAARRSKGYGIVLFSSVEEAQSAIDKFNGYEINGRPIDVRLYTVNSDEEEPSQEDDYERGHNDEPRSRSVSPARRTSPLVDPESVPMPTTGRLYVGNLPFKFRWQELKDIFREFGEVIRSDVSLDFQRRSKGFGTVIFSTPEEAHAAIVALNNREFEGRPISVREDKFADSGNTQVFVGNLPFQVRWQDLKDFFSEFNPTHADISVDYSGRPKGSGVVRFASEEDAENAIKELDGAELDGRPIHVKLDKFAK